jgi:hypothetical protein
MSKASIKNSSSELTLVKIVEDGSAKTFVYEDPDQNHETGVIARLKAKVSRYIDKLVTA